MKKRIIYPSIFIAEDTGYSVIFPDLEGCQTQGDTWEEAVKMSKEALSIYIFDKLEDNKELPKPSNSETIKLEPNQYLGMIEINNNYKKNTMKRKNIYITLSQEELLIKAEKMGYTQSELMRRALDDYFKKIDLI